MKVKILFAPEPTETGGGDAESTQTDTPNAGSNSSIDSSDNPSSEDHGQASGSN